MKQLILFICLFFSISLSAQQVKSGLLLEGGGGSIRSEYIDAILDIGGSGNLVYNYNAALGYRFRLQHQQKSIFYDFDAKVGIKSYDIEYSYEANPYHSGGSLSLKNQRYYYTSAGATFNYNPVKGLNIGAGIEPTVYFDTHSPAQMDCPLVGKIAYNLKFIELGFTYKYGFFGIEKYEELKFSDWVVSMYIPF